MNTDPLLPLDGDYPTDEIDVWPLMLDANGAAHDKRGRFTRKEKRVWTHAEAMKLAAAGSPDGPTVFQWPDEPGVEWRTERLYNGAVAVCYPSTSDNHVKVKPNPSRVIPPPDPAIIRTWAQRNGFPVNARGKLPKAVIDAYMAQRG